MNCGIVNTVLFCAILFVVTGCGISRNAAPPATGNGGGASGTPTPMMSAQPVERSNRIVQTLHQAHREWQGTPYLLGGEGINGVDCSSFTQLVFEEYFGIRLPRNTRQQLSEGSGVRRTFIRPGDLIFFRTGRNLLHVGIAIENGDFLHAGVSQGVMISNLSEGYWASRYLGTRRVL
ncbi:MAG: C40 family peptidase [Balneolaceae bacterium]